MTRNWTQAPFENTGRLDGRDLDSLGVVPLNKEPAIGAVPYQTADGGTGHQVHLVDDTGKYPNTVMAYRWPLTFQAREEGTWYWLLSVSRRGQAVSWIDYGYESDVWVAGTELASFTLTRTPAEDEWAGFPSADYPKRAFVNGVEQTVVSGSSPSAGQVALSGRTLTTTGLSVGDVLELRYVPSYQVVVSELPTSLAGSNDLTASGEIREVLAL